MSARKQTRNRHPKKSRSNFRRLSSHFMSGLLRSLFSVNYRTRHTQGGFVLPTTVLLLLMVTLTVGAMSFRTFSRTEQTIAYRNQQVIDSLAAPAIDRAKAKIEFLFTQDASIADKRPPSSSDLLTALAAKASTPLEDPYTFTSDRRGGEVRVNDTDGNASTIDNVWSFEAPDGTRIIYSIVLDDIDNNGTPDDDSDDVSLNDSSDKDKAKKFIVRNGPIDTQTPLGSCPVERLAGNGWQLAGGQQLAKNIQVNVVATKGSGPAKTVSASEYQQVRTAARGNLWGAWFRYDMEISPGEPLRWNGAMHTEGSLLAGNGFTAYMVSAANSCVYDPAASVIEVSGLVQNDGEPDFLGQAVAGVTGRTAADNPFLAGGGSVFHTNAVARDLTNFTTSGDALSADSDSVATNSNTNPSDIAQDPIRIFTEDEFVHSVAPSGGTWSRDSATWDDDSSHPTRIQNDDNGSARPFLDDGYRADNRYGPKPKYNDNEGLKIENGDYDNPVDHKSGDAIVGRTVLTNNSADADTGYGLDGYWERSAIDNGLRIIVGQRLELGNLFGWQGNNDPLYPPNSDFAIPVANKASNNNASFNAGINNIQKGAAEALQMRSLRDNLAAAQGMVVYHSADSTTSGTYPLACIASTSHPGTQVTLENSRIFEKYDYAENASSEKLWEINFLTGNGTNGFEFAPPSATIGDGTDWDKALRNLTYLAGDPKGGAPSFPAVQDDVVHPYPYLSMWGDFSVLRRIYANYSPASGYSGLSPADKSAVDTARCTLGMLAYNLNSTKQEAEGILKDNLATIVAAAAVTPNIEDMDTIAGRLGAVAPSLSASHRNTVLLYRQIIRDRKAGFLTDQQLTTASPATTSVCVASDFSSVTTNSSQQDTLASILCSTADQEISKYPALYYLFPKDNHGQEGSGTYDQAPSNEDLFDTGGTDYINGINSGNTLYKALEPSSIALEIRTPGSWKLPRATVTPDAAITAATRFNFSETAAPEFGGDVDPNNYAYNEGGASQTWPTNAARNLTRNVIRVDNGSGFTYYRTSMLDKAMMDGRELLSVRVMDLDIDLLTDKSATNGTIGSKAWIREDSGIVYAFREDAVREDSIVRPKNGSWSTCKVFSELTTNSSCYMIVDPNASGYPQDPPLNSSTKISPKPVDMYADPDRRPNGFRLINGESLNRTAASSADNVAGMTFVTDNPVYIKGDFNLHADKTVANSTLEQNLIEEFKGTSSIVPGQSNLLGTDFANFAANQEQAARSLFYARDKLDSRFADPTKDNWRPVEIFADSITIVSDFFTDGWIEDGFATIVPSSPGAGNPPKISSYLNWNRPWFKFNISSGSGVAASANRTIWEREASNALSDASTADFEVTTPVRIDRNGQVRSRNANDPAAREYPSPGPFLVFPRDSSGRYLSFYRAAYGGVYYKYRQSQQNRPNAADPVRVNALLVGGIIPSRPGQTYGGLHNFPRLLEYWADPSEGTNSRPLIISGGFFQLNFSSQAVAPFDQDAWEPGVQPSSNTTSGGNLTFMSDGGIDTKNSVQSNFYYGAAKRIWGYDVALQYSPAAPIAQRFVEIDRPRSEFFRELPVDDPYVSNLCGTTEVDIDC